MTHDAIAWLQGIATALILGAIGILARYLHGRWTLFEYRQKLNITIIYHLATGKDVPVHLKEKLQDAMLNGEGDAR